MNSYNLKLDFDMPDNFSFYKYKMFILYFIYNHFR